MHDKKGRKYNQYKKNNYEQMFFLWSSLCIPETRLITVAECEDCVFFHLVEEAQSQKAPSQRFVDVFKKLLHAIGDGVARFPPPTNNFRCSVGCLVLPQPGDVGYRLPVCVGDLDSGIDCFGLTAMARRGVLIKGGAFLEAIGKLEALAVDKTGTITEGHPRVIACRPVQFH
jgi:Zn2+/Cd2+-exporting ATPase